MANNSVNKCSLQVFHNSYIITVMRVVMFTQNRVQNNSNWMVGRLSDHLQFWSVMFAKCSDIFPIDFAVLKMTSFRHTHTCRNNRFSSSVKFGEANYIMLKPSSSFRTFQLPLCSCFSCTKLLHCPNLDGHLVFQ